jgi:hypothetical protein
MREMKTLQDLRTPLLEVHRSLLQAERERYERAQGKLSEGEFLQALIHDPQLAWLKPLTTLVASLDELLGDREFEKRYLEALQRDPALAVSHGRLARAAALH